MARKKKTLTERISEEANEIRREIKHWCYLREHGCNDPQWPDGVNMNLTRNHVIYGKRRLEELCAEAGIDLPGEYYRPVPPEVPNNYMADMTGDRAQKLSQLHFWLTSAKTDDYPEQGTLF